MNEALVKEQIKEVLRKGMHLVSCKSCGETWFVSGNLKNIMNDDFVCIRCQIKKQREEDNDKLAVVKLLYALPPWTVPDDSLESKIDFLINLEEKKNNNE